MGDDGGSVSLWIEGLRAADSAAAEELWKRYFSRLIPLAAAKLRAVHSDRDGEDIALSAIKSVMIGIQQQRFPDLEDRDSLWRLLIDITIKKALSQNRRSLAAVRDRRREDAAYDINLYLGSEPGEQVAIDLANQLDHLIDAVGDATLKKIIELKLSNYTLDEIADLMKISERTVRRKLDRIRQEWIAAAALCA